MTIVLDVPLTWREIVGVAAGEPLELSPAAVTRLARARSIVEAIVDRGSVVYGVNTGVGALCNVVVPRAEQQALSRNIVLSHAVGVPPELPAVETRAIMAAAVNNFALGHSGVRPALAAQLVSCLNHDCLPPVPSRGSVGYLSHMAHIGLLLIGTGAARLAGTPLAAGDALARIGCAPLALDTKEGLSVVNGTPCATGLACLALARAERLLTWADAAAALSFECLDGQIAAFGEDAMAFRTSPGLRHTAARLRSWLAGSERIAAAAGHHLQDALSLRAVPHVHGAARDAFDHACTIVDAELASVTDNPVIFGTPASPQACSTAHAVAPGLALAMDLLGIAVAEVAAMAERRLDRLINPLVSGLPAFLAQQSGVRSGFMIAQYTAVSLVNENRHLAAPSSLDGGVTSGLQEDHLSHATPAALKMMTILDNASRIVAIEILAGVQASEQHGPLRSADALQRLAATIRIVVKPYDDDRALGPDLDTAAALIRDRDAPDPSCASC